MMPGVLECAAIGVPDEHSGEVPKLFIVKKDPSLTEAQVREHCKAQLTGYKQPKHVEFRTDLPKTNVGKILRRALRDEKKTAEKINQAHPLRGLVRLAAAVLSWGGFFAIAKRTLPVLDPFFPGSSRYCV